MKPISVKNKLNLGLGFLFVVTLVIGGIGIWHIHLVTESSREILKHNYESVEYAKCMIRAMDDMRDRDPHTLKTFAENLEKEERNVTEPGEKELILHVRDKFDRYVTHPELDMPDREIRRILFHIMDINMSAIVRKNHETEQTAGRAWLYISVIGISCLLIVLVFVLYFPAYIANPIAERDQAKTNLIATVSHELKTPITSIKLSVKLLEDTRIGDLNPEQTQLIKNIKEDAGRLLKITGEVLNMAQVETGHFQLNIQMVDPREIIRYALEAVRFQAEQAQVKIVTDVAASIPFVKADIEKTTWVLINLLGNAIHYSPNQSTVTVRSWTEKAQVHFSVMDQGPGIDPAYQHKIFDRFFRMPGSKQGSGLGLAIAYDFMKAQQGTIYIVSEPGKGATFTMSLPTQ